LLADRSFRECVGSTALVVGNGELDVLVLLSKEHHMALPFLLNCEVLLRPDVVVWHSRSGEGPRRVSTGLLDDGGPVSRHPADGGRGSVVVACNRWTEEQVSLE